MVQPAGDGKLAVSWELDPETLPQFSFSVAAFDNPEGAGEPLVRVTKIEPQARRVAVVLPEGTGQGDVHLRLSCRDILDHPSSVMPLRLTRGTE